MYLIVKLAVLPDVASVFHCGLVKRKDLLAYGAAVIHYLLIDISIA